MHVDEVIRDYKMSQIKGAQTIGMSPSSFLPTPMILPITADIPNELAAIAIQELQDVTTTITHAIEDSPITKQELANTVAHFPLLPSPATITPDAKELLQAPEFLRLPPGTKIRYNLKGWDGDEDKCYYIHHTKTGTTCTPLPTVTEIARLLAACPHSKSPP